MRRVHPRRSSVLGALVGLVMVLAGCGESPPPTQDAGPFECVGVPSETCERMLREAQASARSQVVGMSIRCTIPVCSAARGEVATVTVYADGTRSEGGSGWAAPEPAEQPPEVQRPPVAPTCQGVAREMCMDMATSAVDGMDEREAVVSIVVRCTGRCRPASGEGETTVTLRDGTTRVSSWSYEAGG